MKKTVTAIILITVLLLTSVVGAYAATGFTDLKPTHWANSYITQLVNKGGMNGYPDGTFRPNGTMTVAEFVKTTVALIDGAKEPIGNHWASGYMADATLLGIVPDGMFKETDWDKPIPRQKMGVIMERTAQLILDENVVTDAAKIEAAKKGIKDYNSICDYCKEYVVQAVLRGLITGYTDGTFGPEKTATRAEAATMIIRLVVPAYRVFTPETAPEYGVVKSGTDLNDYIKDEGIVKSLADVVTEYKVLENGDKFYLKLIFSSGDGFAVEYKLYGKQYILDVNGNVIDRSNPTNSAKELVQQPYGVALSKVKYFVFIDGKDDIAYIVPNTLQ